MIDTLEFAKSFQQAGFDQPKAEALAGAFARTRQTDREEPATKADLALSVAHLEAKLVEYKLDTERMIRTYVIGSNIGLLVALVALQHFAKVFG